MFPGPILCFALSHSMDVARVAYPVQGRGRSCVAFYAWFAVRHWWPNVTLPAAPYHTRLAVEGHMGRACRESWLRSGLLALSNSRIVYVSQYSE